MKMGRHAVLLGQYELGRMSQKRKKSSSRKKSTSESAYAVKKSFDSEGVHMPAFVSGMVTTLIVVMMTWSHFATKEADARTIKDAASGDSAVSSAAIAVKDFDKKLASASPDELHNILLGLNDWPRRSEIPVQIQANRRRIEVANQMLTLPLSDQQRELAIESEIDAMSVIYGLDFLMNLKGPNVAETLRGTASTYVADANPKISRSARMALLKHDAFELVKLSYIPELDPIANQIYGLLEDYPNDDVMLSTIKLIITFYNKSDKGNANEIGLKLIKRLEANQERFEQGKVKEMIRGFSDEAVMTEAGYLNMYGDRWINGIEGQKQLLETSVDLISRPDSGANIVAAVDRVAHWFEQINEYSVAVEIYTAMVKAADANLYPNVAGMAQETGEHGLQRSSLVNQQADLRGVLANGKSLSQLDFSQKVVAVVFWSEQDERSVEALKNISNDSATWREKGIEVIGVCIDPQPGDMLKALVKSYPRIQFVIRNDKDASIPIFEQSPSTVVPRAMLVDKNGIITDVNVPILELKTEAEYLNGLDE